ncbi:hypothetical protein COR50_11395 [Chitinophaga caeni]|uniref:Thioredoxin domain-containing protein n=1 Tax=Chitinophaga caeni TaxID=2029983 RepID=A0A291QV10_9BACT|nr:redoxin domain-containing protein [Chitinophaga caeni]ATL47722.1 hypothetical protein COR50_11395 [Chitinophaga caeni]
MKKIIDYIISVSIFIIPVTSFSQENKSLIPQQLQIGSHVPEFIISYFMNQDGIVTNIYQQKNRLLQFKEKLIILDFWTTTCSSCIKGFPKLERLQKEFDGKIQIFLVNNYDDSSKIRKWIEYYKIENKRSPIPNNIPIIFSTPKFEEYFPIKFEIGYNVWIGKSGKVILRGIPNNTNEKKIKQYLLGEEITFITDKARGIYNSKRPYFSNFKSKTVQQSSIIDKFSSDFANPYGYSTEGILDSINCTSRNTYLNLSIETLYKIAFRPTLRRSDSIIDFLQPIIDLPDKSEVSTNPSTVDREITDESLINTCFIYEQIVPLSYSDSLKKDLMIRDLNLYFENKKGIKGEVREVKSHYFKLSIIDSIYSESSSISESLKFETRKNGKKYMTFDGYRLKSIVERYFSQVDKNIISNYPIIINNNSKKRYKVTLLAPNQLDSLNDLIQVLGNSGISMKEKIGLIPRLVIVKAN